MKLATLVIPSLTEATESLYPSFETAIDEELTKQTNSVINLELEHDFIAWLGKEQNGNDETVDALTEEPATKDNEVEKMFDQYMPASSCDILTKLRQKKVNLILLATSMNEDEVMKKLEDTLDSKTSKIISLSGKKRRLNETMPGVPKFESISFSSDDETSWDEMSNFDVKDILKRERGNGKDEKKYWKRRNSNNEAAKRSREAKRERFSWIENRTNELAIENLDLANRLEMLRNNVLLKKEECRNE